MHEAHAERELYVATEQGEIYEAIRTSPVTDFLRVRTLGSGAGLGADQFLLLGRRSLQRLSAKRPHSGPRIPPIRPAAESVYPMSGFLLGGADRRASCCDGTNSASLRGLQYLDGCAGFDGEEPDSGVAEVLHSQSG